MKTKVCLFLDYLSYIPQEVKRNILLHHEAEVVDTPKGDLVEYNSGADGFSDNLLPSYRETVIELRSTFSIYTPNILQAALAGEETLTLARFLSPRSIEFINQLIKFKIPTGIAKWALDAKNWFLINSDTPSYELQSKVSSDFPVLIFDNIPIECSSLREPEVAVSNLEEIIQSSGIYQLWGRNNFGEGAEITILDTGVTNSYAAKHSITQSSIPSLDSSDYDGHGTTIADLILSICPKAHISSIKILNSYTDGNIWNFISGMTSLFTKERTVVNLSIGIVPSYLKTLGPAAVSFKESIINIVNSADSQKNFLISAAGNDGAGELRWPSAANNVLAVGSHNLTYELSSFSNYANSQNYILSLGGDLRKFDRRIEGLGRYGIGLSRDIFGTSFSTAIATGISGLLMNYEWFAQMSGPSKISLFRNHCRKNDLGYPILNISDIGAIWPI